MCEVYEEMGKTSALKRADAACMFIGNAVFLLVTALRKEYVRLEMSR